MSLTLAEWYKLSFHADNTKATLRMYGHNDGSTYTLLLHVIAIIGLLNASDMALYCWTRQLYLNTRVYILATPVTSEGYFIAYAVT